VNYENTAEIKTRLEVKKQQQVVSNPFDKPEEGRIARTSEAIGRRRYDAKSRAFLCCDGHLPVGDAGRG
jgi:hypothetical protein